MTDVLSNVQSQRTLQAKLKTNTKIYRFIKNAPVFAYSITSSVMEDIPCTIRGYIGDVDKANYDTDYLLNSVGGVVILQMNGASPDFYIIQKVSFESKYMIVDAKDVPIRSETMYNNLIKIDGMPAILADNKNVIAALKTAPVEMAKLSDIGYPITEAITIQSPWGLQTKPAGNDAYLIFDAGVSMHYMVNSAMDGNPICYTLF